MKKRVNILRLLIAGFIGVLAIIILNIKSIDEITFTDFIPVFAVLLVFGQKDFQAYLDFKTSIKEGIDLISKNSIWSVDYMLISSNPINDKQLIVRNDLLWIEKGNKQNESNDRLLAILISDFEIVAKSRLLKKYLKDKSVVFNLYSSDLKDEKLLKTEGRSYSI